MFSIRQMSTSKRIPETIVTESVCSDMMDTAAPVSNFIMSSCSLTNTAMVIGYSDNCFEFSVPTALIDNSSLSVSPSTSSSMNWSFLPSRCLPRAQHTLAMSPLFFQQWQTASLNWYSPALWEPTSIASCSRHTVRNVFSLTVNQLDGLWIGSWMELSCSLLLVLLVEVVSFCYLHLKWFEMFLQLGWNLYQHVCGRLFESKLISCKSLYQPWSGTLLHVSPLGFH